MPMNAPVTATTGTDRTPTSYICGTSSRKLFHGVVTKLLNSQRNVEAANRQKSPKFSSVLFVSRPTFSRMPIAMCRIIAAGGGAAIAPVKLAKRGGFGRFGRMIRPARILLPAACLALIAGTSGCGQSRVTSLNDRRQGERLYRGEQYPAAAASFEQSVRADPRNYEAFYYLGATYEKLGQPSQAIRAYKTALDVMPLTQEGRADEVFKGRTIDSLAHAVGGSDAKDLELNDLERRAETSNSADDALLLAESFAYAGDADNAIQWFAKAAELDPKSFDIAKQRGLYLARLNQEKPARAALIDAYAINPKDPEVNAALTKLNVVLGPSLRPEKDLSKPVIPLGPIPQLSLQ